ncbi:MAG TPA: IS256 family transposase [Candidatus Binataceae bacterium]|nr:IS256 family transposase [Candidatus Binataceae bacterium]
METDSRSSGGGEGTLAELMRERIRAMIEALVGEELEAALGAARSQRVGPVRTGYRHGQRARTLTTSLGATTIPLPRARIEEAQGQRREWHSRMIPRYQRRTARVDEAIVGVYLSGANTRRLRGALAPRLRGAPLSKDGVSRLVGRLREDFEAWAQRDLGELKIRYLFLDGWYPRVRIGKKRVRVPVLVTLGVCANGQRVVLELRLAGGASEPAWLDALRSLAARNLGAPRLAVIDGNPGLAAALKVQWPTLAIQRCTNHKLWTLLATAPAHLREELAEDYRRMIYAESRDAVEHTRVGFARKWKLRCKAVSASFEEAGDELFTCTAFPASQWKALRTTNALERITEEFRRRTKTQASLPNQEAVLFLLFGLLRSGQVRLRRLVGWQDLISSQMEAA